MFPAMEQTFSDPVPSNVWATLANPELKRAFAKHLSVLPENDDGRFKAAKLTLPGEPENSFLIYQIMALWPNDPVVLVALAESRRNVPAEELPTVEQTAREVYNLAIDNSKSVRERLDAYRLYGELRQMIGKAGNTTNNNLTINQDNRGVYVIPQRATAMDQEAFGRKAIEQQARLIANAQPRTITAD